MFFLFHYFKVCFIWMPADSDVLPEYFILYWSKACTYHLFSWSTIPSAIDSAQNGLSIQSNPLYNLIFPLWAWKLSSKHFILLFGEPSNIHCSPQKQGQMASVSSLTCALFPPIQICRMNTICNLCQIMSFGIFYLIFCSFSKAR